MARTERIAAPRAVTKSSDTFPVSSSPGADGVLVLLAVLAACVAVTLTDTAFWLTAANKGAGRGGG